MADSNLTERDLERDVTRELKLALAAIPSGKLTLTEKVLLLAVLNPIRDRIATEEPPVRKLHVV